MKRQLIYLTAGVILAAGVCFPAATFAVPSYVDPTYDPNADPSNPYGNGSNSTQYEYYDENGQIIDDENEQEGPEPMAVYPDTSWFDYTQPKKEYKIYNEADLLGLASLVNDQQVMWKYNKYETFEGVTFTLMNDIDLTQDWVPIGNDEHITFKGVFDGNGHVISGLNVDITGDYGGFFGYLSGSVEDLTIKGSVKATGGECGAFAGHLTEDGKIARCVSEARVTAKAMTGGIVGYNNAGTVWKCSNKGSVTGTIKVGGIAGENWGKVLCCSNAGDVISKERGITTFGTGGVAGRSVSETAKIDRCYNKGRIESKTEGTGGIVGYTNTKGSIVSNCYNVGTISVYNPKSINTIGASKGYAGGIAGIVGVKGVDIVNCYSTGTVMNSDITGGIIGKYDNTSKTKEDHFIRNNYFTSQNTKYGIGIDSSGGSRNITNGTTVTSTSSLISGAVDLGPYYIIDSSGSYGNMSLPVLNWQKPLSEDEIVYISNIPVEVQQDLNEYVRKHNTQDRPGETVMMYFNHYEFTSKAIGEYNKNAE